MELLPREKVEAATEKLGASTFFGLPIVDLSREELLYCVSVLMEQMESSRKAFEREREIYSLCRKYKS